MMKYTLPFYSKKTIGLPKDVIEASMDDNLTGLLFPRSVGFFPKADRHMTERSNGCEDLIIIFCLDGIGQITMDNTAQTVNKWDCLIIPPNKKHLYEADSKDPWTIWWAHFKGKEVDNLLKNELTKSIIDIKRVAALEQAFLRLFQLLKSGSSKSIMRRAMFRSWQIFGLISDTKESTPSKTNACPPDGIHDERVQKAISYMHYNINRQLKIQDFCQATNTSKSTLASIFKHETSYGIIDYFIRLKMQKACELLDSTNQSIQQIAFKLGFDDQFYFSRRFKTIYDISPKHYRKLEKG